jgi:hypothetical protein
MIYSGFYRDASGYGELLRREMANGGTLRRLFRDGVSAEADVPANGDVAMLRRDVIAQDEVEMIVGSPIDISQMADGVCRQVGYTCWETDRLPRGVVDMLKTVPMVYVPSRFTCAVMDDAGITAESRHVTPRFIQRSETPFAGLSSSTFMFYCQMSWQPRKNPSGLLTAYLSEFDRDRDDVVLVIKVPDAWMIQAQADAQQAILAAGLKQSAPRILILGGAWPQGVNDAFHARGDCYVCLSRGESLALPLLDAWASGVPVIATGWSAPAEYVPRESLVEYRRVPVMQNYTYFDARQQWADPDILHAAHLMRKEYTLGRRRIASPIHEGAAA